jgi:heme oxygenase
MSGDAAEAGAAGSLSARLQRATQATHTALERSVLMQRLLRGQMARADYAALLRSLHPIYAALEAGLSHPARHPVLAALPLAGLARAAALARDLCTLHGDDWPQALAPAPAAQDYAAHLVRLAREQPALLAAHAYVRYLGDLHGGQALARVVTRGLGLAPGQGVAFYDFGSAAAVRAHVLALRRGLDRCAPDAAVAQAIVDEAVAGFERHRRLFDELAGVGPGPDA